MSSIYYFHNGIIGTYINVSPFIFGLYFCMSCQIWKLHFFKFGDGLFFVTHNINLLILLWAKCKYATSKDNVMLDIYLTIQYICFVSKRYTTWFYLLLAFSFSMIWFFDTEILCVCAKKSREFHNGYFIWYLLLRGSLIVVPAIMHWPCHHIKVKSSLTNHY